MFDMLAHALSLLLNVEIFVVIFLGSILGILLGATPGLTGIMAIAIIIPFTYYMDPVSHPVDKCVKKRNLCWQYPGNPTQYPRHTSRVCHCT